MKRWKYELVRFVMAGIIVIVISFLLEIIGVSLARWQTIVLAMIAYGLYDMILK